MSEISWYLGSGISIWTQECRPDLKSEILGVLEMMRLQDVPEKPDSLNLGTVGESHFGSVLVWNEDSSMCIYRLLLSYPAIETSSPWTLFLVSICLRKALFLSPSGLCIATYIFGMEFFFAHHFILFVCVVHGWVYKWVSMHVCKKERVYYGIKYIVIVRLNDSLTCFVGTVLLRKFSNLSYFWRLL